MFTRDLVERVASENMFTNGKLAALAVRIHSDHYSPQETQAHTLIMQTYTTHLSASLSEAIPEMAQLIADLPASATPS